MVVLWEEDALENPLSGVLRLYLLNFPHPTAVWRKLFTPPQERLSQHPCEKVQSQTCWNWSAVIVLEYYHIISSHFTTQVSVNHLNIHSLRAEFSLHHFCIPCSTQVLNELPWIFFLSSFIRIFLSPTNEICWEAKSQCTHHGYWMVISNTS